MPLKEKQKRKATSTAACTDRLTRSKSQSDTSSIAETHCQGATEGEGLPTESAEATQRQETAEDVLVKGKLGKRLAAMAFTVEQEMQIKIF